MKLLLLLTFFTFGTFCGFTQDTSSKEAASFDFWDITFHSTTCNGICPDISLSINSNRKVQLIRTIYQKKGVRDSTKSGGFMGELGLTEYNQLLALIQEIDWENLQVENVICCDRPIRTIIVGYNGKSKSFKSMVVPKSTERLVTFLTNLATNSKLPKYTKPMDFEVILD